MPPTKRHAQDSGWLRAPLAGPHRFSPGRLELSADEIGRAVLAVVAEVVTVGIAAPGPREAQFAHEPLDGAAGAGVPSRFSWARTLSATYTPSMFCSDTGLIRPEEIRRGQTGPVADASWGCGRCSG